MKKFLLLPVLCLVLFLTACTGGVAPAGKAWYTFTDDAGQQVVLYEKLPIKSSDLKNILSLTQALKRKKLIPDAITYGIDNAPVLTYGDVSVFIGDTTLLTKKVERLSTVMPSLSGMSGTLHLEDWNEENTNIVFQKSE